MVTKWLKSARNLETRPESPYWPNLYILVQYQSLQNKIEEDNTRNELVSELDLALNEQAEVLDNH